MEPEKITQEPVISLQHHDRAISLWRYGVLLVAAWTGMVIISLLGNLASKQSLMMIWLSHGLFWLLGVGGIVWGANRLDKSLARQRWTNLELQETKSFVAALIEASPLAIMDLDNQGRVRLWNPAAATIFGWNSSEVVGQPPPFFPENPQPEFQELYSRGLQGEAVRGTMTCYDRHGLALDVGFSMNPLYGPEDKFNGVMVVMEDITDLRHTEKELFKANEQLKAWVFEFSRRNKDITLLNELGDVLQACVTVEEAYKGIGRYASRMFPDLSGAMFVVKGEKKVLKAVVHWGDPHIGAEIFFPEECWALRRGQEHQVHDPGSDLLCGHLAGIARGSLCVPMIAHGETLGLLLLIKNPQERAHEETLNDSKKRLAVTAAKQIALSLANVNLRNSLQEQAIRDSLTGLFNRRYMEEMLEREISRVRRKGSSLGIIMLDLDFFKRFNDTFGHEGGDTLLQALGGFLQRHIRREDIACRYGGEEFIVILPEAPFKVVVERAEQLRQGVENLQVVYQDQPLGPITMSLGMAVFPAHGGDAETVIRAADAALYRAKKEGRNRVVIAGLKENQEGEAGD